MYLGLIHYGKYYLFEVNKIDYGSIHSVLDTNTKGHQTPCYEEINSQDKVQSEKGQDCDLSFKQPVPK